MSNRASTPFGTSFKLKSKIIPVGKSPSDTLQILHIYLLFLNPAAGAFPVACCGVSERMGIIIIPYGSKILRSLLRRSSMGGGVVKRQMKKHPLTYCGYAEYCGLMLRGFDLTSYSHYMTRLDYERPGIL
jgi:hypothetical protein